MTTWQSILIVLGWFACGALAVWMGRATFDSPWYILVAFFFGGPLSIGFVLFVLLLMMGSI